MKFYLATISLLSFQHKSEGALVKKTLVTTFSAGELFRANRPLQPDFLVHLHTEIRKFDYDALVRYNPGYDVRRGYLILSRHDNDAYDAWFLQQQGLDMNRKQGD